MARLFFKLLGYGLALVLSLGLFNSVQAQCPTGASVVSFSHVDVSCFGFDDGEITVQLSENVDNFELFDNNSGFYVTLAVTESQTSNSVTYSNVYPSSFQVVAFKVGCTSLQITDGPGGFQITEPTQLAVAVDDIDPDCDTSIGSGTGSIAITITGGTAPYSFLWSDGATSEDRTTLDAGNYHVDVTDANGCVIGTDAVVPVITQAMAGPDQNICADNTVLAANSPGVGEMGTWTLVSGSGLFSDPSSPTSSVGSLGFGDNVFRWTITDSGGVCAGTSGDVTVTRFTAASVDAGAPIVICSGATATLAGTIGGSATSAVWTTAGDGTFNNPGQLNAVYTPGVNDLAAGTVVLTLTTNDPLGPCPPMNDNVTLTINEVATVDAGPAQTICMGDDAIMAGTFGGVATGITWSTSGDGSFNTLTNPSAIYTPGPNDIAAGTVTLTIVTDDPAGPCGPVSDNMVVTINPLATVDAGLPQTICSSSAATMSGSIGGGASSATWTTSGDGTFDDPSSLTAIYTPGTNDLAAGTVTLTLTTDDPVGPCVEADDTVVITIEPEATVEAGSPQIVCEGDDVTLAGAIGGSAASGSWSTPGDGTFNNNAALNAIYTPGPNDIAAGTVTLTLTTDDPAGTCPAVSDDVAITVSSPATVDAGSPQSVCAGTAATLAGVIGGSAGSATWSTAGDGTFDNSSLLNAVYTPGANDLAAGTITLTLTSDDPAGPCGPVSDDVVITIDPAATVDAGTPQTICSDGAVTLAGAFGGSAGSASWTTSGDGTFDNATALNAVYTPGANDLTAGSVTLTLTTNDPAGACPPVSDNVVININPIPAVDAGTAQTICAGNTATLAGVIGGGAGSATWSTSGDGAFNNASLLNAIYTPGTNDLTAGTVTLTLTSDDPAGPCLAATDDVAITIDPAPTADAGVPQTICATDAVLLAGAIGGSAVSSTWTTAGDGTFDDNTALNATYTPGANDIAAGSVTLTLNTDPTASCPGVTDDVTITITPLPTPSAAGADKTVCGTTNLEGNVPVTGTGTWTIINGVGGVITDINDPVSQFSGVSGEVYVLEWTISTCASSSDQVQITFDANTPTIADAGGDQMICSTVSTSTTLMANGPLVGTGLWTVTSGSGGSFGDATSPGTLFTGAAGETYVLRWTITTSCASSSDEMTVAFEAAPSVADAGTDIQDCDASVTLNAAAPASGTGQWSVVSGAGGTFVDDLDPATDFTGVPGTTYTLRWTVSNSCASTSDDLTAEFETQPTVADAGPDKTVCGLTNLEGNTAIVGTGMWTIVNGAGGVIADPANPLSNFSGTAGTVYTLEWTITNGSCAPSADQVTITFDPDSPTPSDAGPDQAVCAASATLAGNSPAIGTGQWSVINGAGGSFVDDSNQATLFNGVAGETYTLRWTITSSCGTTTDDVEITLDEAPTVADAGSNLTACGPVNLGGNTPLVGTGVWAIITGTGGVLADPNDPNSVLQGTGGTTYTLQWTISNGSCVPSTDLVDITFDNNTPTIADAGPNQNVCGTAATLAANIPVVGTGQWTVLSGAGGSFADDTDPASSFTGVAGTAYQLLWTISNGGTCTASSDDVVVVFDVPPTVADAGPDQQTCGTTVTLAGNAPVTGTGSWSTVSGAGGSFADNTDPLSGFSGMQGTTYMLRWTISNACGNSTDDVQIILDQSPTVADAGVDQTVCGPATLAGNAPAVGTGTWTIVSGAGGIIADPSNPASVFSGTGGTTYTLAWAITNGTCVVSSDEVDITFDLNTPTIADAGADQNICDVTTALAANVPVVGTGQWSIISGAGGSFADDLDPATVFSGNAGAAYTLRWTISNGMTCAPSTDDVSIVFEEAPAATDAGADQQICGSTATLAGSTPVSGTGLWTISSGAGGSFTDNTSPGTDFNGTAGETYVLRWTITNSCGSDFDEVSIRFDETPTPSNAGADQVVCGAAFTTLAANAPGAGNTGLWIVISGAGGAALTPNSPTSQFTGVAGATYTLRWIISNGGVCPPATDDVVINFAAAPVVSSPVNACVNGAAPTLQATATGATSINWYSDAALTNLVFTGTNYTPGAAELNMNITGTTSFYVNATYACGDSPAAQVDVNVVNTPGCGGGGSDCFAFTILVVDAETQRPSCSDQDDGVITLDVSGVTSGNFIVQLISPSDTLTQIGPAGAFKFINLSAASYSYRVTDAAMNVCQQPYDLPLRTIVEAVASNPVDALCFGDPSGKVTMTITGGNSPYEYSLDGTTWVQGLISGGEISGLPANGTYPVLVRDDDTDLCPAEVLVTINSTHPQIQATFDITPATCGGGDGAIAVASTSGGSGSGYVYSINGGVFGPGPFTDLNGGMYTLTVRDGAGCSEDFDVAVTFPGFVNHAINAMNADCNNNGMSGAITVSITDAGVFSVALSTDQFNEPDDALYQNYTAPSVTFDELVRDTYFIYIKSTGVSCPTRSAPIVIGGAYAIDFELEPICDELELSLALTNITGEPSIPFEIQVFRKFTNVMVESIPVASIPPTQSYLIEYASHAWLQSPNEYQIQIVQVQSTFCLLSSGLKDYSVPIPLFAAIGATEKSYPDITNGSMQIINFSGPGPDYTTYIRLDSAAVPGQAFDSGPDVVPANLDGDYEMVYQNIPAGRYEVIVTDRNGCSRVLVARVPLDTDIYVPNVFTPNGDGVNDVFFIRNLPDSNSELIINNRWGGEVYSTRDYQNNWDGGEISDGVYYYRLSIPDSQALTGWVEIIRGAKP